MKVRHLKRNALPRRRTSGNTQWIKRRCRLLGEHHKGRRFGRRHELIITTS